MTVAEFSDLDWGQIADFCGVSERTLRDWRKEKYLMTYSALLKLHKASRLPLPPGLISLPDYWSTKKAGRKGALNRYKLYGNPGTAEGRRKGGLATWQKYTANPQFFKNTGFVGRKKIRIPHKSKLLAEFTGILLGDGNINKYQVKISLNAKTDREYGNFITDISHKLFGIRPTERIEENTLNLVLSGINLTRFLQRHGLKSGNKITQQVNVPDWILQRSEYSAACLRGLVDTDGGIFCHRHSVNGKEYNHHGLCFTAYSLPLLESAYNALVKFGFNAKIDRKGKHIFLYRKDELKRYFDNIGTSNPTLRKRYKYFLKA